MSRAFLQASSSQGVDRQDVSANAISASKQGQEAIRDLLGCLRDLMVPFCHFMDQKNGGLITPHQAFTVTQQYCEIVQQLQANREVLRRSFVTVREQCQGLREPCAEKLIPYTDRSVPLTTEVLTHSESRSIVEAHDQTVNRYLEVSDELERMRRTLTTALWELNDLMDPVVLKQ